MSVSEILNVITLSDVQLRIIDDCMREYGETAESAFERMGPRGLAAYLTKSFEQREVARILLMQHHDGLIADPPIDMMELHFNVTRQIELFYRDRDVPGYYEEAIKTCLELIGFQQEAQKALSVLGPGAVSHLGYKQLAIVYEKEHRFEEAMSLCKEAKANEWMGDWDKRIARLTKKIEKAKK